MLKLSPLMLLYNKDVQKDLNLNDDQVLKKVSDEVKFQREVRRNLKEVNNDQERNQKMESLNHAAKRWSATLSSPNRRAD